MERALQTHAPRRQAGCWAGPLLTSDGRSQTYMARDSFQDRWKDPPPLCLSLLQLTSSSWAVYLRSPNNQWQVQGGKTNLEKNFALIQLSHLRRDQFELSKSWTTGVGRGCNSVARPSLKMELGVPHCAQTSPDHSEYVHNTPVLSYSTCGDLSVQSSVCTATSSSTMTVLQLLKPPVPATAIGSVTPVRIRTLKLGSTMTDN